MKPVNYLVIMDNPFVFCPHFLDTLQTHTQHISNFHSGNAQIKA